MIGFKVRRFMSSQVRTVAQQVPVVHRLLLKLPGTTTNGNQQQWLLTPEEAEYMRKAALDDDGDVESRCVFSVRRARTTVTGIGGLVWNVCIGTVCAPLLGLTVLSSTMREDGFQKGAAMGAVYGFGWSLAFASIGVVAGLQQLCFGVLHDLLRVYYYVAGSGQWDDVARSFASPPRMMTLSPLLSAAPLPEVMRDVAQRRALRNKKKSAAARGEGGGGKGGPSSNNGKKPTHTASDGSGEGEDLYAVLGIDKSATEKHIKEAFNKLALSLHPDRNPSKDAHLKFDRVTKAYKVLSHEKSRKKYDAGGHAGLEDQGLKKRDAVRAVLGGDDVVRFAGDVRTSPIFLRVVDGLDYLPQDAAVVRQRMIRACAVEVLSYLDGYPSPPQHHASSNASASGTSDAKVPSSNHDKSSSNTPPNQSPPKTPSTEKAAAAAVDDAAGIEQWLTTVKRRMVKFSNTALARETIFVVGHEYRRTVLYTQANPAARITTYVCAIAPRKVSQRAKASIAIAASSKASKDVDAMMNIGWHWMRMDLEANARETAILVLLDGDVDASERRRRMCALDRLSGLFIANGAAYTGANKQTTERLMESLQNYQRSRAMAKDEASRRERGE